MMIRDKMLAMNAALLLLAIMSRPAPTMGDRMPNPRNSRSLRSAIQQDEIKVVDGMSEWAVAWPWPEFYEQIKRHLTQYKTVKESEEGKDGSLKKEFEKLGELDAGKWTQFVDLLEKFIPNIKKVAKDLGDPSPPYLKYTANLMKEYSNIQSEHKCECDTEGQSEPHPIIIIN